MTDRDALRAEAEADIDRDGPDAWAGITAATLITIIDAATRAEAQSEARHRALGYWQQRTHGMETQIRNVQDVLDQHPDPRPDTRPNGHPSTCGWKHAYAAVHNALNKRA